MAVKKYRSISTNAILNMIRYSLSVLFPLITYPYIFRVLHVEAVGKINFAESMCSYFVLFAGLGVSTYATREGVKVRDDETQISSFASEIHTIQFVAAIVSYILLGVCISAIPSIRTYNKLLFIYSFSIAFTTIGCDWINNIYEDYLYITIRSVVVYLFNLILLFLFVKGEGDYYIYAVLSVLSNALICLMNRVRYQKYVQIHLQFTKSALKHLKAVAILFVNQIAISIYLNIDISMIGLLLGDTSVGLYSCAVKIYNVIKRIMSAIYMVFLPRLSIERGREDFGNYKSIFGDVLNCLILIVIPTSSFVFINSREIVLIMGGEEYFLAIGALRILCLSLIAAIFGGVITVCLNIPFGKELISMKATVWSSIINVMLNILFIRIWGIEGAAFTTLISELFVPVYCLFRSRQLWMFFDIKDQINSIMHAVIGIFSIGVVSFVTRLFMMDCWVKLIINFFVGVLIYFLILVLIRNRYVKSIIQKYRMCRNKNDN